MKNLFLILLSIVMGSPALGMSSRCNVRFDLAKSKIEGTGYKFINPKGVTAKFTEYKLSRESSDSLEGLLNGLVVEVNTSSIDSGNPARDTNLKNSLFFKLLNNGWAKVTVKEVKEGHLSTTLRLNGKEKEVSFDYAQDGPLLVAKARIELADFAMLPGLERVKKLCEALHRATPKEPSKTWPYFDLKVSASIVSNGC